MKHNTCLRFVTLILLTLCAAARAEQAASVSQYGITWTFDKPYLVGKFVTGDWWVVGPVQVVKVDPAPKDGRNGSMVNPKACLDTEFKQAFDNRIGGAMVDKKAADRLSSQWYDEKVGATFPLALKPGQSLISAVSQEKIGVFTATLQTTAVDDTKIVLNLTSQMEPTIYDYPLTVKIRLSDSWKDVTATQAGKPVAATMIRHDNAKYALVKALPDGGEIVVQRATKE
jgi:hypothetical protein